MNLKGIFWQYGLVRNKIARRHRIKGNVQFILWNAGEQGHKENYWYNYNEYWWQFFIPY